MKSTLFFAVTLALISFSLHSEDQPKHGPRFDYYNLRGKPMRHGFVFQGHGEAKNDDMRLKAASAVNGKKVYTQLCLHCHGPAGKGNGEVGKELVKRPADLSALSKEFPSYHFFIQISDGVGKEMPSWQDALDTKEVWDLIAYIKTLKK